MTIQLPPSPQLDEALATAIVRDLVRRQQGLFAAYPDYDRDDLFSVAMTGVRAGWPNYNGKLSQPQTFIHNCALRKLLNLSRDLSRRARRDAAAVETLSRREAYEDDECTLEWLEEAYQQIRKNFEAKGVPLRAQFAKRKTIDRAQNAALAALRQKLGMTQRGCAMFLQQNPHLLEAIGLRNTPDQSFFARFSRRGAILQNYFAEKRMAA